MKQGWSISTIGSVANVFNGNSINAEEKKAKYEGLEEGYPFIATKDVGVNGKVEYNNGVKIPFDTDFKIAMPDAVFVCAEGGSAGKKVAHIDRKVCFGNKLFALQPIKEKIIGGFLYYAVQEAGFKAQFRLLMAGIIGGVSVKKFNSITIPVPPLAEQHRIVALLDSEFAKIDTLKANAERNLQNAKELFQAALRKELEPKEGWVKVSLSGVCAITSSLVDPCLEEYQHLLHVGGANIISDNGVLVNLKTAKEEELTSGKYCFDDTMVLYNKIRPYLKKVARPDFNGLCSADMYPLKPNGNITKDFLYYILLSDDFTDYAIKGSARAGMPKVNREHLFSYECFIPNTKEQGLISSRLDALSEKCKILQANYEKTLNLCDDLKQALLRKAFNGEIK